MVGAVGLFSLKVLSVHCSPVLADSGAEPVRKLAVAIDTLGAKLIP